MKVCVDAHACVCTSECVCVCIMFYISRQDGNKCLLADFGGNHLVLTSLFGRIVKLPHLVLDLSVTCVMVRASGKTKSFSFLLSLSQEILDFCLKGPVSVYNLVASSGEVAHFHQLNPPSSRSLIELRIVMN